MPRPSVSSTNQISLGQFYEDSKSKRYFIEQVIEPLKNKANGSNTPISNTSLLSVSDLEKINSELDYLLKISQERIREFEECSNKLQNWLNTKLSDGSNRDDKYNKYSNQSRSKVKEENKVKSEYKSSKALFKMIYDLI